MAGITNGDIILDSIFIECELEDESSFFVAGCPDPITDSVDFRESNVIEQL